MGNFILKYLAIFALIFVRDCFALDPGAVSFKFKNVAAATQTNFELYLRMADFSKKHLEELERSESRQTQLGFVLYDVFDASMNRLGIADGLAVMADVRGKRELMLSHTSNFVFKFDGFEMLANMDASPYSPNSGLINGGSGKYNGAWGTVSPHEGKDGMTGLLLQVHTILMTDDWGRDNKNN